MSGFHVCSSDPREINRVLGIMAEHLGKRIDQTGKIGKRTQSLLTGLGVSTSTDAMDALANLLNGILDDDILSAFEKPMFIILYENTIGEYEELLQSVTDWDLLEESAWTVYVAARTALVNIVEALAPAYDDVSQDTDLRKCLGTGGGKTLAAKFKACNDAKWAVHLMIQTKVMGELSNILSDDVLSRAEKPEFVKAYLEATQDHLSLSNQAELWGLLDNGYWEGCDLAETNLVTAVEALSPAYNDMTQDTALGTGGGAALIRLFYQVFTSRTAFEKVLATTVKTTVDDILAQLESIFSDDVLSKGSEKTTFGIIYKEAISDHDNLLTLAAAWSVTDELGTYVAAYTALVTLVESLVPTYVDQSQDTPLNGQGDTLLADFQALYDARTNLKQAIDLRVKDQFDSIFDDDKLTPPEKVLLEQKVAQLYTEKFTATTGVNAQADTYGVSRTNYDAAWAALMAKLAALTGWNSTTRVWTYRTTTLFLGIGGGAVLCNAFLLVAQTRDIILGKINNLISGTLSDIYSDDVLTPPEKQIVQEEVSKIILNQTSINADAVSAGLSSDSTLLAYNNAVTALKVCLAKHPIGIADKHWCLSSNAWYTSHLSDTLALGTGGGAELRALVLSVTSKALALTFLNAYCQMRLASTAQATALMADWLVKYGLIDSSTGTINANTKILPGSITTPLLAANIMFAKQMVIGNFDNLVPNGTSEMTPPVQVNGTTTWLDVTATSADVEARCVQTGNARNGLYCRQVLAGTEVTVSKRIPVEKGTRFGFDAYVKLASSKGTAHVAIVYLNSSGTETTRFTASSVSSSSYTLNRVAMVQASYDVALQAVLDASAYVEFRLCNTGAVTAYFDDLYARVILDGQLIVDGTITADQVNAASLQAALVEGMVIKSSDAPLPANVSVDSLGEYIDTGVLIQSGASGTGTYALLVGKKGMRVGQRYIGDLCPVAQNRIANGAFAHLEAGWNISETDNVDHYTSSGMMVFAFTGAGGGYLEQTIVVPVPPQVGDSVKLSLTYDSTAHVSEMYAKVIRYSDDTYVKTILKTGTYGVQTLSIDITSLVSASGNYGVMLGFTSSGVGEVHYGSVSLIV